MLDKAIRQQICQKLKVLISTESLLPSKKSDHTFVTQADTFVSELFEDLANRNEINFFSEENPIAFVRPCLVLDPIDGTKELLQGSYECCVSLAYLALDSSQDQSWLFNPFTGFFISSEDEFINLDTDSNQNILLGYVSNSEWRKYFDELSSGDKGRENILDRREVKSKISLAPKGSIALKLGLLASGACDFVYSHSPKKVWDIAAGTIILWKKGFKLYQDGQELNHLNKIDYNGKLLWCRRRDQGRIRNYLNDF